MMPLALLLVAGAAGTDPCLPCHAEKTPGVIAPWKASAHRKQGVGCIDCHPKDVEASHVDDGSRARITVATCTRCHETASESHLASAHGRGFRAGRACTRKLARTPALEAGCVDCHESDTAIPRTRTECARFLAQSPAMQRQGCLGCHAVENRCDTCHGPHDTDLAIVRDPAVCATCHMGPDHAQYEMWQTSRHGVAYARLGRERSPDCVACHLVGGTHDVSQGISMGLAGQPYPEEKRLAERKKMLDVCAQCHTRAMARRQLEDADAIQKEAKALVDEAAALVKALEAEGLLEPAPSARPAHPLSGRRLDLGPQMLYENLSRAEAIFFRMKKFDYVTAYKGAFHQNPDYAHWYGNAPLKLHLSDLKSEAALLRKLAGLERRLKLLRGRGLSDEEMTPVERELRELHELHLDGSIDDATFEKQKDAVLEKHGL